MIHTGNAITVKMLQDGIAEFRLDLQEESFNHLNQIFLDDLAHAIHAVKSCTHIQGLLVTSSKSSFMLGKDIQECLQKIKGSQEALSTWIDTIHNLFNAFEDLSIPKVALITGTALDSGFEFSLTCDYRLITPNAHIAFADLKLGVTPLCGASVRLPRIIGLEPAAQWLTSNQRISAEEALKLNAVHGIVSSEKIKQAGIELLKNNISGQYQWQKQHQNKITPIKLNQLNQILAFKTISNQILNQHPFGLYPAYALFTHSLERNIQASRNDALRIEKETFMQVIQTPHAHALTQLFLNDQTFKNKLKRYKKNAHPIQKIAIIGKTSTAYTLAQNSLLQNIYTDLTQITSQDFITHCNSQQDLMAHAATYLLQSENFEKIDFVFETPENFTAQRQPQLLALEQKLHKHAILGVHVKHQPLSDFTHGLQHPENIVGLQFFTSALNTHCVELVYTGQTSEITISSTLMLLQKLGKTPVLARDSFQFFIRRIAYTYLDAIQLLLKDGVPLESITQALQHFGWEESPQQLIERLELEREFCEDVLTPSLEYTTQDILDRILTPLCNEVMHCLSHHIIPSVAEAERAVILVLGFPPSQGGLCQYVDDIGVEEHLALCEKYESLGKTYQAPQKFKDMLEQNSTFYSQGDQ